MKILVLGCNGMAGHLISLYFKEQGHEVVGFARQQSSLLDNTIIGDASDMTFIKQTVDEGNYDAISIALVYSISLQRITKLWQFCLMVIFPITS